MNKIKNHIAIVLFAFITLFSGCSDFLDTNPRDTIDEDKLWSDPASIKAYLARLYSGMEVESFEYEMSAQAAYPSTWTDEAIRSYTWGSTNDQFFPNNLTSWWNTNKGYFEIRDVNDMIKKVPNGNLRAEEKELYLAEAKFIRAFYYFTLARRYGGVPIIKEPQEFNPDPTTLRVPRSTEKDTYLFILEDLNAAIVGLPDAAKQPNAENLYRATKYAALALKSQSMLHAACIAKYGVYDAGMNGLCGIQSADADFFFNESKKASEEIIKNTDFKLYEKDADKEANFQNLFLDKVWHEELIFVKAYTVDKAHSFDYFNAPQSFKVDYGCATNPTLELVEAFDYIDGSEGTLKVSDSNGKPIEFDNPYDLFKDKDPRLMASVLVPFGSWQGDFIDVRRGIIEGISTNAPTLAADLTSKYKNTTTAIGGKDGIIPTGDPTKTGFYLKKYMNPGGKIDSGKSTQNYIVYRFAEIYLNYAEAAVELNQDTDKALDYVNKIRDRAGVKRLTSINLELVRKERQTELAFENRRWWDLIRWRKMEDKINNHQFKGLFPYLLVQSSDLIEGQPISKYKVIFKREAALKIPRVFSSKLYYNKIDDQVISSNPTIIPNPGY
ncbi:RagB/SusD family nutrient uptake outer membrane protein [Dysgonomonas sp. BGC7]|uniref:RagB/SusD family nutrient uptake outer membrane protein n=1 Tax=Dysgonomonas sp. BGC7 TaxID=1658008 RepID=UPI0006831F7A|nr:RagB/SusD family nutrient uptake outer membrane protein [Dysgonomonas sp. BGC7]MBD8390472.1 RagB/SusD family nutrient uptake outer membrane protein [Dysgonomonas sp. BGC7]